MHIKSISRSCFSYAVILIVVLLGFGFFFPTSAQQPVTGGEEGIIHVRKLKQIKGRVHLEWLYLEDNIDNLPAQKELIRSGEPVEFSSGYLYHGRDGLDEILVSGVIPGECYFTRAPHVWAIGSFQNNSHSPAILVIEALDFNRMRDSGQATLEAEISREHGIMDPYPRIERGFSLKMVKQIWIDLDTAARYDTLVAKPDSALSQGRKSLKKALLKFRDADLFIVIPGLHHTRLTRETFFPEAFERTGAFFVQKKLTAKMPAFRARKTNQAKT